MWKEKENGRKREKWTEINGKRYRNVLRHGQRQKYCIFILYFFCRAHIAVGYRIQGGSPGPLRLKYAVDNIHIIEDKLHSAAAKRNPKKSPDGG